MPEKTKENPTGSPLGKFSILNLVVKGVDALTGYDRSKEYFDKKKPYQKPRRTTSDADMSRSSGKTGRTISDKD